MHINILTSSTQHQTALFHVVERTKTFATRTKMKNALAKCAKLLFLIVKSADSFLLPSSSWLRKFPNVF